MIYEFHMVYLKCGLNGRVFHYMNRCLVQNVKRDYIFCEVVSGNGRILYEVTLGPPLRACLGSTCVQTGRIKNLFMSFITAVLTEVFFHRERISKL